MQEGSHEGTKPRRNRVPNVKFVTTLDRDEDGVWVACQRSLKVYHLGSKRMGSKCTASDEATADDSGCLEIRDAHSGLVKSKNRNLGRCPRLVWGRPLWAANSQGFRHWGDVQVWGQGGRARRHTGKAFHFGVFFLLCGSAPWRGSIQARTARSQYLREIWRRTGEFLNGAPDRT